MLKLVIWKCKGHMGSSKTNSARDHIEKIILMISNVWYCASPIEHEGTLS